VRHVSIVTSFNHGAKSVPHYYIVLKPRVSGQSERKTRWSPVCFTSFNRNRMDLLSFSRTVWL